jgi:hypothetical protein
MVADGPKAQPPAEVVAAALEESRLEARLLRVSSTLFLKEAKEYIEGGKVGSHERDMHLPLLDLSCSHGIPPIWFKWPSGNVKELNNTAA